MGFYVAALLFYALTLERLGFIAATIVSVGAHPALRRALSGWRR